MQKLLTLTTEDFLTGISPGGGHIDGGGLFQTADGINPFKNPFSEKAQTGLLQTCVSPTDMTGSVVVDTILSSTTSVDASNDNHIYAVGSAGHLYDIQADGSPTVSDLRSGTQISNPTNGLFTFQSKGGSKSLYYVQDGQIGQWDLSGSYPTGWTDNHFTGLNSTPFHPTHKFFDVAYIGAKDRVARVYDNAGTDAFEANVLDTPADFTITALEDDGQYLVIGITEQIASSITNNKIKFLFWDTNQSSWQNEHLLTNSGKLLGLERIGSDMYAVTSTGVYIFNFATKPVQILAFANPNTDIISASTVQYDVTAKLRNALLWASFASSKGRVGSYGKLVEMAPTAYFYPFGGITGASSHIITGGEYNNVYVSTDEPKLYRFPLAGGSGTTGLTATTRYIPLEDRVRIDRIDVVFGEPLVSGDELNIDLKTDEDSAATDWGTYSFAIDGAKQRTSRTNSKVGESMQLLINFVGGSPKIKKIEVYGEREQT